MTNNGKSASGKSNDLNENQPDNQVTRRDFLNAFAAVAGTTLLSASLPWLTGVTAQAGQAASPSNRVQLGFIGTGSRGCYLLELLRRVPNADVAAICDNYPPNLQKGLELTGGKAKTYTNYKDLLARNDLDAVLIATPLYEHFQMVIDALAAGKHVFCEKSMAMLPEQCLQMVQAQKQSGKILQIGHQRLFDIKFLRAMEMIRSGDIGKITQVRAYWHRNNDWRRPVPSPDLERKINWRLYKEYSCGLMTELASHQIQVANWALGAFPESVSGSGSINYWHDGREVYDNVNLVYRYPGGIHLIYDSLTSNKKYGLEEQLEGNKGTIEPEANRFYLENPPAAPGIVQLVNSIEHKIFDAVPIGGPSWVPENPSEDKGHSLHDKVINSDGSDMEMEAFVAMVRDGRAVPGHLEQAYYATVSALLGHQAMLENRIIAWPKELILQ